MVEVALVQIFNGHANCIRFLTLLKELVLHGDASAEGARRRHLVEARLDDFPVDNFLIRTAFLVILKLVIDDADGDFAHHRVWPLEVAVLELFVVEARFVHLTQVVVVNAQVLIRDNLRVHVFGVPGQLQELLEAVCRLEVLLEQPVHVAELLVRDHLVAEHELVLALVLQLSKHVSRLAEVFEVHADHAVCLQRPVVAEELVLLLFFDQLAQGLQDGENGKLLDLPGRVLVVNLVHSD